jgi:outer membrane autotransporter protein
LSAGADVKLSESLIVGAGGGIGHQRTRNGDNRSNRLVADNWVGALYGSFSPSDGAFIDGVLGYGELDMDTRRIAFGGATALGSRDGTMTFGSLGAGIDRLAGRLRYSAYLRAEYLNARLDRYIESGAGAFNLAFDKRTLDSFTSVLGGRIALGTGAFIPRGRFEWRHDFASTGAQRLDYADLGGPFAYRIAGDGWLRDEFEAEVGLGFDFANGWNAGLDLGARLGQGSRVGTVKATISGKF